MVGLTVVTVVRDDPAGMSATLASIAAQTRLPDQIVVVDSSADPDAVPDILGTYPLLAVTYQWSPPSGVYGAMNEALGLATQEYIYFLNAGDSFAATSVIQRVGDALGATRPAWAYGRVDFLAADGTHLPQTPWSYDEERRHLFARGRFPAHQGVVVLTADLRSQGGFDQAYTVTADYLSVLKFARVSDPLELDGTLAVFTIGGLSSQRWQVGLKEFHRARREVFQPSGPAAISESARTGWTWLSTSAYRTLWAPGRPLHAIASRLRPATSR